MKRLSDSGALHAALTGLSLRGKSSDDHAVAAQQTSAMSKGSKIAVAVGVGVAFCFVVPYCRYTLCPGCP